MAATASFLKRPQCLYRLAAALGLSFSLATSLATQAGDILRGGAPMGAAQAGSGGFGVNPPNLSTARSNARDALARTTQAVQSVKTMQAAARAAASKGANNLGLDPNHAGQILPNVPNGLAVGGLQVAPGVPKDLLHPAAGENSALWQGANLPVQKTANGKTDVTIKQTSQNAFLTWQTFNIGADTTLDFDQSAGGKNVSEWIAFNQVLDPSGRPSQILGAMRAPGQVYLINQNGIIFGGASQINLHTLVASSLPINDNLTSRGLLNNPDVQFLFSELPQSAGANGTPAFTPDAALTPSGKSGDVTVQAGAQISSPTTPDHVGGRVALVGANVVNAGTISTPDGQTILAAGEQVGFSAHASSDPSLRGLDTYIGAVDVTSGVARNSGLIEAPRADVTIAGKDVQQLGAIDSTTSVSLNGRIDLLANFNAVSNTAYDASNASTGAPFLNQNSGSVTFGAASVTRILPEWSSAETVAGTQLALPSQINAQGLAIHLAPGADVLAPNANVALNAGNWNFGLVAGNPASQFVFTGGQIYIDSGANIDVAGSTDVSAPISRNILSLQLRGAELAESPLQRDGLLRGVTLNIDVRNTGVWNGVAWIGTPLGDVSGYVALIERTVGELTTAGGSVKMNAGDSVVMQRGSKVDVSGGWINYQGGEVQTTHVISSGQILDISQATPDRVYDGIYDATFTVAHLKYGLSETFANPLAPTGAHFENGYTSGADAGSIAITAPGVALDGNLLGNTVAGPRQRASAPAAGNFSLSFEAQHLAGTDFAFYSPTPPSVIFSGAPQRAADAFSLDGNGAPLALRADRLAEVLLSPELLGAEGFGTLKIDDSDGDISVPKKIALRAAPGGSITLSAANIHIAGSVTAPGGSLSFSTSDVSPFSVGTLAATPAADATRGHFTLGVGASLSSAGLLVDDRFSSPASLNLPLAANGGAITINAFYADLAAGSTLDVSGGALIGATGKRTYGDAGSISIKAGSDPNLASLIGGKLHLAATLSGFAGIGAKAGALTIQAPLIQIGGIKTNANTLLIAPDFFSAGGFGNFTLNGLGANDAAGNAIPGIVIAPGVQIAPVAQTLVALPFADDGGVSLAPMLLPEGIRAPVSLAFNATGVRDSLATNPLVVRGDFVMGAGASIRTDAGASVSIGGDTAAVLGSIFAPGGSITINGAKNSSSLFQNISGAVATVDIGPRAILSTAGGTLLTVNADGYRTGSVFGGGKISVTGNIVAERGALLDVSGASDSLDFPLAYFGDFGVAQNSGLMTLPFGSQLAPMRVDSAGGTISLSGGQELFVDAALRGAAGGPGALGGSLQISSGRFTDADTTTTPLDPTLLVTQNGVAIPASFYPAGGSAIGRAVLDKNGNAVAAMGYFAADQFRAGGFDSLALKGSVEFSGAVAINAARQLSVADGGVIFADGAVRLSAPHVALGQSFIAPLQAAQQTAPFLSEDQPFYFAPGFGAGSLTVRASLIEIGNLSLQNIGSVRLLADGGDIRGDGTLDLAGDLFLRAAQIYPPTASTFTIAVYDYTSGGESHPGSVTIAASGARALPLSAGGQLNIFASNIAQDGVLRAPFGSIALGWDGAGSAPVDAITGQNVSVAQQVTLGSHSVTSVSAIDPLTGAALVIPYGINVNGSQWIDPRGVDISASGPPQKAITIAGVNIADESGSVIDLRGGGDLYAYRWVSGNGGTQDLLASSKSFAVVPGFGADFAPYAPFNPTTDSANLASGDPGYVNSGLAVGDRVYLDASSGLPAGIYTLLPARYALLPGAFLVTPQNGAPIGTVTLPDGSSTVAGYRFNDSAPGGAPLLSRFEIDSAAVVRARAEYDDSFANSFLTQSAQKLNAAVPRLPRDSGHLVLAASQAMNIAGRVESQSLGGRGGLVDISSPGDIVIAGPNASGAGSALVLDARELSGFGAESLLVGGVRDLSSANGVSVSVTTKNLTVDNAGAPLTGADIILAANENLTLAAGALVKQTGAVSGRADTLLLGDADTPGSGDGVLLRVSSDPGADIVRAGVDASTAPAMTIGADAQISGASLTLDSTRATTLDPTAVLVGKSVALRSGQISIQLDDPGALQPTGGLVLSGIALASLQSSAQNLSLLSYSSLDLYGSGEIGALDSSGEPTLASLALHAGEIRGFNNNGGAVTFAAKNILLDNSVLASAPGSIFAPNGNLVFNANTIRLGANQLALDQFENVALNASGGFLAQNTGGLTAQGNLTLTAPLVTAAKGADQTITALGALTIQAPSAGATASVASGLGAELAFIGSSVSVNSDIALPSGALTFHATSGDVTVGNLRASQLDASGVSQTFFDLTKYTSGGTISLLADAGNVNIADGSTVNVSAQTGGGDAGSISVSAANGAFTSAGTLLGQSGANGNGGTFLLEVGNLASTAALDAALNTGGFMQTRTYRVRTGDVSVDGLATAHSYNLSADGGSVTVAANGFIDASGATGGAINLDAAGSVTLLSGARLSAAAQHFDDAGKGGAISLEAGSEINGSFDQSALLDIQTGSTIDLSVADYTADSAALGNFTGTLHLRAPQTASSTDLQASAINGSIIGASSISIEGYKLFKPTGGTINSTVEASVKANGITFVGNDGTSTTSYLAMLNRLLANNSSLASIVSITPGAELINSTGNLTLTNNWDLSTYRFGPDSAAGVLTLRAAGNLIFTYKMSLSDGFGGSSSFGLWDAPLLAVGSKSWTYRLTAGADFSSADFRNVQSLTGLAANSGSLLLGNGSPALPTNVTSSTPRSSIIPNYFQTIRTGNGDITINAGRDVQILNPLATIYTAGSQAAAMSDFDLPKLNHLNPTLGTTQSPIYPAQYSLGGGNVTITAQNDIAHYLTVGSGADAHLVADSTKELPTNWLYRRGWVDPATGQFGAAQVGGDVASTSWWIDFSNFFEGVGALGGGNVTFTAGHDVSNVDAVVPTNARMPKGTPNAASLLELGGGDLVVNAGHDISGGVYYVERGQGLLSAGNSIHTNSTRAALTRTQVSSIPSPDPSLWLPTTLFLGKGSFDISASGDVLLGPVANPFLLPQGINNSYLEKTYFSTYAATDAVNVTSLNGDVTIKDSADGGAGSLSSWYQNVLLSFQNPQSFASQPQPWLRLAETNVSVFSAVFSLMPPTLRATSFSGDVNLVGSLTLAPSAIGTIDLAAAGSINGVQVNGVDFGNGNHVWGSSSINLSDADPARVPGVASPLSFSAPSNLTSWVTTSGAVLSSLSVLFNESGSTLGAFGVIQTKQALHASGLLHADDPNPIHLYAQNGDISGLTLYSEKSARVVAGRDVSDIALYLQNTSEDDLSLVSSGRDIVAYDPNSSLRLLAQSSGNQLLSFVTDLSRPASGSPTAGDFQIGGPGTLEILAGRNLDLGVGGNNPDGTQAGITSIGNARNPYLPFAGADIIASAGVSGVNGLESSGMDFQGFIKTFVQTSSDADLTGAHDYFAELSAMLGGNSPQSREAFDQLSKKQQDILALDIFYLVLRDAGRDHNLAGSPGFGTYSAGLKAISTLFSNSTGQGDITTQSRDIRTKSGGNISLIAPYGKLTLAATTIGDPLAPPGIITEDGGNISIFTKDNVDIGISRIFTLRGGDEIIWSSDGDIAAGNSSKTVQSAPPTRVLIDPQSGDVKTDLAGLATGGGIGVLATVSGVAPGNVDLIAPRGVVDAGDAGIRATGNLNVAAVQVLNADNIQVTGASTGTPVAPTVATPNLVGLSAASNAVGAATNTAQTTTPAHNQNPSSLDLPSIITVEVLGYGGSEDQL